jgi:2-polyprenyl-3-methyl-5-hydroxy-6-metoxy-1,4-benzoquinol methylase
MRSAVHPRSHTARIGAAREAITAVVASYQDTITRLYARVRFLILRQPFLDEIGQYLPARGQVLDLGCGFGLFSLYYALLEPERQLTGVDLNPRRIAMAKRSAARLGLGNVRYEVSDVRKWQGEERFDAIYMLDLVHHLPEGEVRDFLESVRARLRPHGILVIKDVSDRPLYKMGFTWLLDRLMVGWREPIRYWPPAELLDLLEALGFAVKRHAMNDFLPYPHVLYVACLDQSPPAR